MSTSPFTVEEMTESLNGFEEIGIREAFGAPLNKLDAKDGSGMVLRALAFVAYRREGLQHADAHKAALTLTLKEATSFFAEDNEVTPEEPETPEGKDEQRP